MRWSLINDVAGKKYDSTFEAMQFFANLKSKDYSVKFFIDEDSPNNKCR